MPFEFICSDLDSAGVSLENHSTMPELEEWRVILYKDNYGKFVPKEKLEEQEYEWMGFHPLTASYATSVQRRIMSFLADMCGALLKEQGLSAKMEHVEIHANCAPYSLLTLGASPPSASTISTFALESMIKLPGSITINELCLLIEAERSQALDHVQSLISDPAYFLKHIRDQEAHSLEVPGYHELLRKVYARDEPDSEITKALSSKTKGSAYLMTGHACCMVLMDAFRVVLLWSQVVPWMDELRQKRFNGDTCRSAHKKHPLDVEKILSNIQVFLQGISKVHAEQLTWAFTASPKMRKYFNIKEVLVTQPNAAPTRFNLSTLTPNLEKMDRDSQWAFHTITKLACSQPDTAGHRCILSEVGNLFASKRNAKDYVSSFLRNRVAQSAVSGHIYTELKLMWPACAMWEAEADAAGVSFSKFNSQINAVCRILERECMGAAFRSSELQYPEIEVGSKQVRVARCRTEERLIAFLTRLSEAWDAPGTLSDNVLEILRDIFASCNAIKHTEPWDESTDRPNLSDDFSRLAVDSGTATSLTSLLNQKARAKPKTRPLVPVAQDVANQQDDPQPDATSRTILLDAGSYQAANIIFNIEGGLQPGEIAWTVVQRFMCDIGFHATPAFGSAVRFSPAPEGIQDFVWNRSITLHSSHPKPSYAKGEIYQVRRHLQRALDLNKESFTMRQ